MTLLKCVAPHSACDNLNAYDNLTLVITLNYVCIILLSFIKLSKHMGFGPVSLRSLEKLDISFDLQRQSLKEAHILYIASSILSHLQSVKVSNYTLLTWFVEFKRTQDGIRAELTRRQSECQQWESKDRSAETRQECTESRTSARRHATKMHQSRCEHLLRL